MDDLQDRLQAHRATWNALPWMVNGTADDAELQRITAHLAQCADCREELAFQQQVRDAMTIDPPTEPHDAEPGLQRLLARIEMVDGAAPVPGRVHGRWRVHALAAAVAIQAVALAALGGLLWGRHGGDYVTLSSAPASAAAQIRFVPSPTLQLSQLRELLDRHRLRVVESSGDAAVLGLGAAWAASSPVDVAATVRALRREPGVLLAEPVGAEASR